MNVTIYYFWIEKIPKYDNIGTNLYELVILMADLPSKYKKKSQPLKLIDEQLKLA